MTQQLIMKDTAEIHNDGSITLRHFNFYQHGGVPLEVTLPQYFGGLYVAISNERERYDVLETQFQFWMDCVEHDGDPDSYISEACERYLANMIIDAYRDGGLDLWRASSPTAETFVFCHFTVERSDSVDVYRLRKTDQGSVTRQISKEHQSRELAGASEEERDIIMWNLLQDILDGEDAVEASSDTD